VKPSEWVLISLVAFAFGSSAEATLGAGVFVGAAVVILAYGVGLWLFRTKPWVRTKKAEP